MPNILLTTNFTNYQPNVFPKKFSHYFSSLSQTKKGSSNSFFDQVQSYFFKTVARTVNFTTTGIEKLILPALVRFTEAEKKEMKKLKENFLKDPQNGAQEVNFPTSDGHLINGMTILNPGTGDRWMIFFNGNGMGYENYLNYLKFYSKNADRNILLFNYRGVLDSQGYPKSYRDLVSDGEAAFQFLINKGINSKDIAIDGISLGGAIGTYVRAQHPDGPIANVNSFSSIGKIIEGLFFRKKNRNACARYLGKMVSKVLEAAQWEMNVVEEWKKIQGRKWIVSATKDELIKGPGKFYKGFKESCKNKLAITHIKSVGTGHNDLLSRDAFNRHMEYLRG